MYLTQNRSITASESFDGAVNTAIAPDFGPFVQTVAVSTTFPTSGGGEAINAAEAGIDCHLDPNRLQALGTLSGAGGISVAPDGTTNTEFGNAAVSIIVDFQVDAPTMVSLLALPRPSADPNDKFKIKLQTLTGGTILFLLDETSPPQDVNVTIPLDAGQYKVEYEAELTVSGDQTDKAFGFDMLVPAPGATAPALLGLLGLRRRR